MPSTGMTFWVGLPPGATDLALLRESAGLAEPLVDLRYGPAAGKRAVVEDAVRAGLVGLTVFADLPDETLNLRHLSAAVSLRQGRLSPRPGKGTRYL